jgi:hypothetical protein
MAGCGVCLYGGGESETVGYRCKIVKAGKPWECCECGTAIPKGTLYELASGFHADDGNSFWQAKTCVLCAEIGEGFYCDGRWHGGNMWDRMESVFAKLTTACFDRLKTPEAKRELRRRWMEWKGLPA